MRVTVTGSEGFIGQHTVQALRSEGHQVYGIDQRANIHTSNYEPLVRRLGQDRPDLVVNLAGNCSTRRSLRDPLADWVDNAHGSINVADVCADMNVPLVHISTVKVRQGDDGLWTPLGLSKLTAEHRILYRARTHGLRYCILRPGTIYGPGQAGSPDMGWVTWFVRAALEDREIEVTGSGEQGRDVLYISDFVRLLVDCADNFEQYQGGTYSVGGGAANYLTPNKLLSHLGHDRVKYVNPLPGDLLFAVSGYDGPGGWEPAVDWRAGVRDTLEYLRRESGR